MPSCALINIAFASPEKDSLDLEEELFTHFGIAHTRWATHGEPSIVNSHPHRSDKDNGNTRYRSLRKTLLTAFDHVSNKRRTLAVENFTITTAPGYQ